MRDDPRYRISATVVFVEYLTQKAPDGRDRAEDTVAILDALFVEHVPNAGLGQNVRERESLIALKAGTYRIKTRHGTALPFDGDPRRVDESALQTDHC